MTADTHQLDELSARLWEQGVSAFCPTTLSVEKKALTQSVSRLGKWIHSHPLPKRATPLGIHLEGPFINHSACGAHLPAAIRPLDFAELDELWEASSHTLKLLTTAPELLNLSKLRRLVKWSQKRKIILSIGHSRATLEQARIAFDAGFTNVTHGWNALHFHHRDPGVLGAAFGQPKIYVELIPDGVHISPILLDWGRKLHPKGICFVSDCVPATSTPAKSWHSFGNLRVTYKDGASRLASGELAGGGLLLSRSYIQWINLKALQSDRKVKDLLKQTLPFLTQNPLKALGLPPSISRTQRLRWKIASGRIIGLTRI